MNNLGSTKGKCRKKDPATCRLHGKAEKERHQLMIAVRREAREQREREIKAEFHQKALQDFHASWKLRTEPDGTTSVSVYRSGVPSAPAERGVEKLYYQRCDEQITDDRQGRMNGVFCSPTLGGVSRWVRGNELTRKPDIDVREIRVDIDSTYVYLVHDWERASAIDTPEMYKKYWANGITMREYMEAAKKEPHKYDPREFELLVPEDTIISVKPVSMKRAFSNAYDFENNESDYKRIIKQAAYEKRMAG